VEGVGASVGLVSLAISLLTGLGDLGTGAGLSLHQLVGDKSSRISEYIQQ
jgi:hypothetical protein